MNTDDHPREQLGAYVLGQMEADEARRVRAHLRSCRVCAAEHDEIAPLAAPLGRARTPNVDAHSEPSPDLGERIFARIDAERRGDRDGHAVSAAS